MPGSTGVGPLAFNIAGRVRVSTSIAYLDRVRGRAGLDIVPKARCTNFSLKEGGQSGSGMNGGPS